MTKAEPLVCIVDDSAFARRSMEGMIRSRGLAVEVFSSGQQYLLRAPHTGPVCLITDSDLGDMKGSELQRLLVERGWGEQLVFIAESGNLTSCVKAIKAGAVDYLQGPVTAEELLPVVDMAIKQAIVLRDRRAFRVEARERVKQLTRRQLEVLMLILKGRLNREIALTLGAAEATIKIHRRHIMENLKVETLPQLIVLAHTAGLIRQGNVVSTTCLV